MLGVDCVRCSPSCGPLQVLPSLHATSLGCVPSLPFLAKPLITALHPHTSPSPVCSAAHLGGLPELPRGVTWREVLYAMFRGPHRDVSVRVKADSPERQAFRERALLSLSSLLQPQPLPGLASLVGEAAVLVIGGRGGQRGQELVKQRLLKQDQAQGPSLGLYRAFVEAQASNGQLKEATRVAQAAAAMGNHKMQVTLTPPH